MNYQTTPIIPQQQPKKKSTFGLVAINIVRVVLLIVGALGLLICASPLWTWIHCNSTPTEMTFEDYINKGADNDWVVLTGVYVDGENKIETQLLRNGQSTGAYAGTYFPLRTGPNDKRPVKVFLEPTNWGQTFPQPLLMYESGPPSDKGFRLDDRQVLRGLRQRGIYFSSDLEKVLRTCKLGTTDDIILIKQREEPISAGLAAGMIGFLVIVPILFMLTFLLLRR